MWYINECTTPSHICADNAFADSDIKKIIELSKNYKQEESEIINIDGVPESSKEVRSAKVSGLEIDNDTFWLYNNISFLIDDINKKSYQYNIDYFDTLMVVEYDGKESGHYSKHMDASFDVNDKFALRKLSFVMQLSDENSYEGGDLILYPGVNHEKSKICIPRKKGTIVIFPSRIIHEVTPVTSGIRHSLITWIYGPKFK